VRIIFYIKKIDILNQIKLPYINDFLLELASNNYSIRTTDNYTRDLWIFSRFLEENNLAFMKISKKTIALYKGYLKNGQHLNRIYSQIKENVDMTPRNQISGSRGSKTNETKKDGLGSKSINRMLSTLRSYLRFLIDYDHKTPIPPDAIKLVKAEKKESQVADFEDLVKLVEFPTQFEKIPFVAKRNRAILELLFSTGMRISELAGLNLDNLDLTADKRKIRQGKIYIWGKGKKQRFVYLTKRAISHLETYLAERIDMYPALFIPQKGIRASTKDPSKVRLSVRYIQSRIENYRRLLGIIVPTSAHSLRHGFATYLAEKGANPAAIQRLLGHESLQTTTRYVHASDRFAQKTHTKYHPLG